MQKYFLFLAVFACVFAMVGCGGGGGGKSEYHVNRGDNGAGLEKNGFKAVNDNYKSINKVISNYDKTSDKNGQIRANAIVEYISENYKGKDYKHKNGAADTPMSTKSDVQKRLAYLIKSKEFENLEIIPFRTNTGKVPTEDQVSEQTKLYVAKAKQGGQIKENLEYTFDNVIWKNEGTKESPDWKIISGFDDLGKNSEDFKKNKNI